MHPVQMAAHERTRLDSPTRRFPQESVILPSRHVFLQRFAGATREWFWSSLVCRAVRRSESGVTRRFVVLSRLAATIGNRSALKKISRRSIVTADVRFHAA